MSKLLTILAGGLPFLKTAGSWFITIEGGPLGWVLSILDTLWQSQTGRIIIIVCVTSLATWVWCWNGEHAKIEAARLQERAAFQVQIKAANDEGDRRVNEANATANKVAAVPSTVSRAMLKQLCKADRTTCRDALAK